MPSGLLVLTVRWRWHPAPLSYLLVAPFLNRPICEFALRPFCKEPSSSSECSPVNRTLSPFRSWEGEKVG